MTMNLRRSTLDTKFLTLRTWADVPLDMAPPLVGFTASESPGVIDWHPTDWAGNSTTQDDPTKPRYGLNWRLHRILLGPADPAIALAVGRWWIWRYLEDNPEIPVETADGTITFY